MKSSSGTVNANGLHSSQEESRDVTADSGLAGDVSPLSLGLFGLSAITMLGVGFKIGTSRKIEEGLSEFDSIKRLEKVMENSNMSQSKIKPSAPPTVLARRALGATMIGIGVGWYMGVKSFQEWSDRLKEIVPVQSKRIEDKMGPSLDSVRDGLNDLFSRLTPVLVKGRQDRTPQQLEDEKKELEAAGIDPTIIDPLPERRPRKQA